MIRIDYDTKPYWDGCAEKRLVIAQCDDCAHWIHPPKSVCPNCWATEISRHDRSGAAHVYTFTEIPQKEGKPRISVWAQLDDADVIVMGELDHDYDSIAIGDALTLTWNVLEDRFVPGFRKKPDFPKKEA